MPRVRKPDPDAPSGMVYAGGPFYNNPDDFLAAKGLKDQFREDGVECKLFHKPGGGRRKSYYLWRAKP